MDGQPTVLEILIVEDNEADAEVLQDALSSLFLPMNITAVSDGEKALAALLEKRFDVVFLDLNMPRMTGHELLKELSENTDILRSVSVIVTTTDTASAKTIFSEIGFRVGAYMVKPMRLEDYNESIFWAVNAICSCRNPPTSILHFGYEKL